MRTAGSSTAERRRAPSGTSGPARPLWVCELGLIEYKEALQLQNRLRDARLDGVFPDTLLLLEHPPVYTRGRRSMVDVVDVDRGTYHGPGQLVGYPIMRIQRVSAYVDALQDVLVGALADLGVAAVARASPFTGIWVGNRKIASIGIHVRQGVTMHGFALNVDNDLQPFGWVVACGDPDLQVTSVEQEVGRASIADARAAVSARFAHVFHRRGTLLEPDNLAQLLV